MLRFIFRVILVQVVAVSFVGIVVLAITLRQPLRIALLAGLVTLLMFSPAIRAFWSARP